MRSIWLSSVIMASITIGAIDATFAQKSDAGKDDYLKLCAGCHGATGKGDGPNAKTLRKPATDLTKLLETNNGRFPLVHVYEAVDGKLDIIVHGQRDMPTFFELLKKDITSRMPQDYMSTELVESMARKRMIEIIDYVMSLQNKSLQSK